MSIDNIKEALPEYAKDLKLNFGSIVKTTELSEEQLWGALVATAAATKSERLLREIAEDALDILSRGRLPRGPRRGRHHGDEQRVLPHQGPARRRVRRSARGSADEHHRQSRVSPRSDFELWSLAVSAINGCGQCVAAHEKTLRDADVRGR